MVPEPESRPDYEYWSLPVKKRRALSSEELEEMNRALEAYSKKRFALRRKFRLRKDLWGIKAGSRCIVISTWPKTEVVWENERKRTPMSMSFELDINLKYEE